ncbi:MAG: B12-binding domain-containing radical SAM protein [Planctomycetota bacterium]|jgi:radical SAM superfamily enzyme YgiQ (UPF0313 family)
MTEPRLPTYSMPLYRPPSEANSLLIQVTLGCPHNQCTFCPMYKGVPFRTRPAEEIFAEIEGAAKAYGNQVKTIFLPDGNTIVLKTEKLLPILERIKAGFPSLERVTCYGSAKFAIQKSAEEWKRLKNAGLTRIHMGIESGDAETLKKIEKGATPEEMVEAGKRVRESGIEVSEYVLVGIAGPERSQIHARASAEVLNAIEPHFVRLRTYVPVFGTPMWDDYEEGRFTLQSAHECLREIRTLVEFLKGPATLLSDHLSNYADITGKVPDEKEGMLEKIDECLSRDEDDFRDSLIGYPL